jgi:hypothetical protein
LKAFAKRYRLKVREDECGDAIIPGRFRGADNGRHLYFAGEELCLMVVDGLVTKRTRWESLGARKLWLGTISVGMLNAKMRNEKVQDVKVEGIPEASYKLAIRLAGCKAKQTLSPKQLERNRRGLEKLHGDAYKPGSDERESTIGE